MTAFVVVMLLSYGHSWAIVPLLAGVALAVGLFYGWDRFVRGLFTPEAIRKAREKQRDRRWALVVFALIKYPLVALLLWVLVRAWYADQRRILVFVAGFLLLQTVIVLRAMGRMLIEKNRDDIQGQ